VALLFYTTSRGRRALAYAVQAAPLTCRIAYITLYSTANSVNTDDAGVFNTSLSRDYALLADSLGIGIEGMAMFAMNGFQQAFDEDVKLLLIEAVRLRVNVLIANTLE
jgi:Adenosine deaminase